MSYLSGYEGLNGDVLGQIRSACMRQDSNGPASSTTSHQHSLLVLIEQVGQLAKIINDDLTCIEEQRHPMPERNGISVAVVLDNIHKQLIKISATATAWGEKALAAKANGKTEGRRF